MSYLLSVIDDALNSPAVEQGFDSGKPLYENCLSHITEKDWSDSVVKELIIELLQKEEVNLSGYSNPNIFLNEIENNENKPDIVIFDWDFGLSDGDAEDRLIQILETVFCFIFIFLIIKLVQHKVPEAQ